MKNSKICLFKRLILFLFFLGTISCNSKPENKTHIFYLHGRIVQEQGSNAISEKFGKYEYTKIIDSLKIIGDEIHAEIRKSNTKFDEFCIYTSNQIDSLVNNGVNPGDILVVGASMGGVMAMKISTINRHPINYVFLGSNNKSIEEDYSFNLHGRILGIYEKSDSISNKDYQYWIDKCEKVVEFEQLQINTELGHGFLYSPLTEWITPLKKMIKSKNEN